MIEEFNGPLVTTLKAYTTDQWTVAFPTILLDLRTVFEDEIQVTTTDLIHVTSSQLPDELVIHTATEESPQQLVEELKTYFSGIHPRNTSRHEAKSIFIYPHLSDCSHVFQRHDGEKKPL